MYIRRKVFSLLQDETGEERYFSTTDIVMEDEEERLFSIVDEEQREFARRDYEGLTEAQQRDLRTRRNELAKEFNKRRHIYNDEDFLEDLNDSKNRFLERKKAGKSSKYNSIEDVIKSNERRERESLIQRLKGKKQLAYDTIKHNYSYGEYGPSGPSKKSIKNVPDILNKNSNENGKVVKEVINESKNVVPKKISKETAKEVSKKGFKLGKAGKIALGAALVGGTAYGTKKLYDRNKKKKD